MRIPPLSIEIMLESNPLKSRILVRRLAVDQANKCVHLSTCPAISPQISLFPSLSLSRSVHIYTYGMILIICTKVGPSVRPEWAVRRVAWGWGGGS